MKRTQREDLLSCIESGREMPTREVVGTGANVYLLNLAMESVAISEVCSSGDGSRRVMHGHPLA